MVAEILQKKPLLQLFLYALHHNQKKGGIFRYLWGTYTPGIWTLSRRLVSRLGMGFVGQLMYGSCDVI